MAYNIDFKKVDSAFQHLADTPEGNKALDQLAKALDQVQETTEGSKLNESEAHYLLTNLVKQRKPAFSPGFLSTKTSNELRTKVKSGFVIKSAVTAE
jgi:hypothetical protein